LQLSAASSKWGANLLGLYVLRFNLVAHALLRIAALASIARSPVTPPSNYRGDVLIAGG
jgi:hypothetical protein